MKNRIDPSQESHNARQFSVATNPSLSAFDTIDCSNFIFFCRRFSIPQIYNHLFRCLTTTTTTKNILVKISYCHLARRLHHADNVHSILSAHDNAFNSDSLTSQVKQDLCQKSNWMLFRFYFPILWCLQCTDLSSFIRQRRPHAAFASHQRRKTFSMLTKRIENIYLKHLIAKKIDSTCGTIIHLWHLLITTTSGYIHSIR